MKVQTAALRCAATHDGWHGCVLIIKSKSIDSSKDADEVSCNEVGKLREHFKFDEMMDLEPFHSDHAAVIAQK